MNTSGIINEAMEFILHNVENSITADDVAAHCHISGSYFNRLFREQTGESVYAYIRKKKLEFSAFMIKTSQSQSITDIASTYGYSSSNYSSAFKDYFKKSPAEFRKEHVTKKQELFNRNNHAVCEVYNEIDKLVTIETLPDQHILYERFINNYSAMKKDWLTFTQRYEPFTTADTVFFERTYDDPTIADENKCLYDICMSTNGFPLDFEKNISTYIPDSAPPNFGIITGGKFVICPFSGYLSEINSFHQKLMGIWLPLSGNIIDTRCSFDRYSYVDCDTYYMKFDICIPVK